MPETRSGHSYNAMEHGSNDTSRSNPNTDPDTHSTQVLITQQQMEQISHTLDAIMRRLDAMDDQITQEGIRGRRMEQAGFRGIESDENIEGEEEVQLGGAGRRGRRFFLEREWPPHAPAVQQVRPEPLDELAKQVKVDVPEFWGRLDPDAFHDWLVALEDYFVWYSVSEARKVRFVIMKLKGPARA